MHILQLLRHANKHTHCLQLYISINITPTCFDGQATIIWGTKGHRLRSASKVIKYYM
jgi:ornithine carbamoyltransferase